MNPNPSTNPDVLAAIAAGDVNPKTGLSGDWSDFTRMERDERWLGHGYLGARRSFLAGLVESGLSAEQGADLLDAADEVIHSEAANQELSYDQLFTWCNSKPGRWFGDLVFGSSVYDQPQLYWQAERFHLLPTVELVNAIELSA